MPVGLSVALCAAVALAVVLLLSPYPQKILCWWRLRPARRWVAQLPVTAKEPADRESNTTEGDPG